MFLVLKWIEIWFEFIFGIIIGMKNGLIWWWLWFKKILYCVLKVFILLIFELI